MKYKIGDKVKVAKVNFDWKKNWVGKTFTIREINPNNFIGVSEPHYAFVEHCPYVFMESELLPVVDSKIVITTDGKITTAKLYENNKVTKTAEAKCCPEDTFDFNVGAEIAFNQLVSKPCGTEPPKPKYYNGKVVCVKSDGFFTVGKVYEFINGRVKDNDGVARPGYASLYPPLKTLDEDNKWFKKIGLNFIPFVEG